MCYCVGMGKQKITYTSPKFYISSVTAFNFDQCKNLLFGKELRNNQLSGLSSAKQSQVLTILRLMEFENRQQKKYWLTAVFPFPKMFSILTDQY